MYWKRIEVIIVIFAIFFLFACSDDKNSVDPPELREIVKSVEYDGMMYDAVLGNDNTLFMAGGAFTIWVESEHAVFIRSDLEGNLISGKDINPNGESVASKIIKVNENEFNLFCRIRYESRYTMLKVDSSGNLLSSQPLDYIKGSHSYIYDKMSDNLFRLMTKYTGDSEQFIQLLNVDIDGNLYSRITLNTDTLGHVVGADMNNNDDVYILYERIREELYKYYVMKINVDGVVEWVHEAPSIHQYRGLQAWNDGGCMIFKHGDHEWGSEYILTYINEDGQFFNSNSLTFLDVETVYDMAVTPDNNLLLLASSLGSENSGDFKLLQLDSSFDLLWEWVIDEFDDNLFYKMKMMENDDLLLFGFGDGQAQFAYLPYENWINR